MDDTISITNPTKNIQLYKDSQYSILSKYNEQIQNGFSETALEDIEACGSVGKYITNAVQNYENELKYKAEYDNLSYHINEINQKINYQEEPISTGETAKKFDLKKEWIEQVSHIPPEEKILSAIWQGWFTELRDQNNIADLKMYLEKMKKIDSSEAEFLLFFKERRGMSLGLGYYPDRRIHRGKRLYLLNQLLEAELIEKDNYFTQMVMPLAIMFTVIFILLLFYDIYFKSHTYILSEYPLVPISGLISALLWVAYCVLLKIKIRYQLTWIGLGIVNFANKMAD